jgi:hypothetical protein
MVPDNRLNVPPFQLNTEMDPAEAGKSITECIGYFTSLPAPLTSVLSAAIQVAGNPTDPLYDAGMAIARDIEAGVGAGLGNEYHNKNHLCEVVLCAVAISKLASLSQHESALLFVAAVAHDFHHDGLANVQPYRLESLAAIEAEPYCASLLRETLFER